MKIIYILLKLVIHYNKLQDILYKIYYINLIVLVFIYLDRYMHIKITLFLFSNFFQFHNIIYL
jgi:hypothetical protein